MSSVLTGGFNSDFLGSGTDDSDFLDSAVDGTGAGIFGGDFGSDDSPLVPSTRNNLATNNFATDLAIAYKNSRPSLCESTLAIIEYGSCAGVWQAIAYKYDEKHSYKEQPRHYFARSLLTGLGSALCSLLINSLSHLFKVIQSSLSELLRYCLITFVVDSLWQIYIHTGEYVGDGFKDFGQPDAAPGRVLGAVVALSILLLMTLYSLLRCLKLPKVDRLPLNEEIVGDTIPFGIVNTSQQTNVQKIMTSLYTIQYILMTTVAGVGFYMVSPIDLSGIGGSPSNERDVIFSIVFSAAAAMLGAVAISLGLDKAIYLGGRKISSCLNCCATLFKHQNVERPTSAAALARDQDIERGHAEYPH